MASSNVMEFTTQNWDQEVVKSAKPVLVDFWAPWCGPCRMLAPTIDRLAEKFAGRVKVGKLNIDDHQEVAVQYSISSIPQVLIFQGEKLAERMVGFTAEKDLEKVILGILGG